MLSRYAEKTLARILSLGTALTAILVVSGTVTDPVNAPKLVTLGLVGGAAFGFIIATFGSLQFRSFAIPATLAILFLVAATSASLFSGSPWSQNLYGTYGRNNGLIAYLLLALILVATSVLSQQSSFDYVVKALIAVGVINILYCGWVIIFGDFIGWNNPYGNILGTFGNPNFIGAFLGIFLSAFVAFALSPKQSNLWKWSLLFVVPVTLFEIVDSSAIQGRVVAAGGLALVAFSYLRFRVNKIVLSVYSIIALMVGVLAALGALQIGPLTQYIYKTSVSLRGQYWLAGWNAGEEHPFTGVGMDAFGDWFRRARDPQAIILPGVNTVVNAAHNVFMDMFAFGGWPLLITYVALVSYSGYALVRTFLRLEKFDGTFTAISVAWVGYQIQSIISINQIGLAIWGWLLGGTLIAYEKSTRNRHSLESDSSVILQKSNTRNRNNSDIRVLLVSFVSALIGLVAVLPPFVSDTKWQSAMFSRSLPQIEESMNTSYFNPPNVNRYLLNIQTLEQSNQPDLAYKYALQAVAWNPESYELWRLLYFISKSTSQDKERALVKMRELDPHNPDVTAPR